MNTFQSFLDFLTKCGPEIVRLDTLVFNKDNSVTLESVMASSITKNLILKLISSSITYDRILVYPSKDDDSKDVSTEPSFEPLHNDGVYSIFIETESESHKFIIITCNNKATYIGTYGGYSKFSIYQCTTSQMITYLSQAYLSTDNIDTKSITKRRVARMLFYCNLDTNAYLPHLYDDNFITGRVTRLKIKKLNVTIDDFNLDLVIKFKNECLQTIFKITLDANGDVYNPNIDANKINKYLC